MPWWQVTSATLAVIYSLIEVPGTRSSAGGGGRYLLKCNMQLLLDLKSIIQKMMIYVVLVQFIYPKASIREFQSLIDDSK